MKRRYLLLLAVISVALILVLPGTALAAYETPSTVTATGWCYWDLDSGTFGGAEGSELFLAPGVGTGDGGAPHWLLNACGWGMAPVAFNEFVDSDGVPTCTFDSITYADLAGTTWRSDEWYQSLRSPFVVHTAEDNYFKLQLITAGWGEGTDWVWLVQRLQPVSDPDAQILLGDLRTFIMAPTTGSIDAAMVRSLTAKVEGALAALARGNQNAAKVARNELMALVNQTMAQTGKKIAPAAAAEIMLQATAVNSALGY